MTYSSPFRDEIFETIGTADTLIQYHENKYCKSPLLQATIAFGAYLDDTKAKKPKFVKHILHE
jgi:hypothetical protein